MKVLGLTGGIASGKSVVSNYFKQKGFKVIDADQIVHELYKKDSVIQFIDENFHVVILNEINRRALGDIIFNDSNQRQKLEDFIHPLVYQTISDELNKITDPWVIVDIPLLYETQGESICDMVLVVYVDLKTQISRLMKRDSIGEKDAINKINAQLSLDIKISKADIVIDNSGSLNKTYEKIDHIIDSILI